MSAGSTGSKVIVTFLCMWALWIVFTGSVSGQELLVGGISAAFVAGISYGLFTKNPGKMLHPKRWGRLIAYFPAYIWAEMKAHADVAARIINPSLPLKPAIVKVPSKLESDVGLTTLANSITMTPGTLSVDVDEDNSDLYVHWIDASTLEEEGVQKEVGEPLEKHIRGGLA